jgi:hypothetical protein
LIATDAVFNTLALSRNVSVPPSTAVAPVYGLALSKVSVFPPILAKRTSPLMLPLKTLFAAFVTNVAGPPELVTPPATAVGIAALAPPKKLPTYWTAPFKSNVAPLFTTNVLLKKIGFTVPAGNTVVPPFSDV